MFVTVINDDMCFIQINNLHLYVSGIYFASSQNRMHSLHNRILVKLYHILHILTNELIKKQCWLKGILRKRRAIN